MPTLVALAAVFMQGGMMDAEEIAVNLLRKNEEFAEAARVCFMYYQKDIYDTNDFREDPEWTINGICGMFQFDIHSTEYRHVCMRRFECILLGQFFDKGYIFESWFRDFILNLDIDDVVAKTSQNDKFKEKMESFRKDMTPQDVEFEVGRYAQNVRDLLEGLKSRVSSTPQSS